MTTPTLSNSDTRRARSLGSAALVVSLFVVAALSYGAFVRHLAAAFSQASASTLGVPNDVAALDNVQR